MHSASEWELERGLCSRCVWRVRTVPLVKPCVAEQASSGSMSKEARRRHVDGIFFFPESGIMCVSGKGIPIVSTIGCNDHGAET